jgi:hypothetical protein
MLRVHVGFEIAAKSACDALVRRQGAAVVRNALQLPDIGGFPADHQLARVAMTV